VERLSLYQFNRVRLEESTSIKPFDCGDPDLNDFLFSDSIPNLKDFFK